jgi:serine/threonine protein kinase
MDVIGTRIGGYQVVEHLASGGMGAVYVARHELLGREAVIKLLHSAVADDPEIARRFVNEARAATQIQHPGIVEIFEMGTRSSGHTYIAMERLRGQSLAQRLEQHGPLTLEELLALVRQLGSALGAAHDAGIVHRDLKPQNLFLVSDPSVRDPIVPAGERLKILDFGVAKLGPLDTLVTATGALLGTPAYMAPEQCASAGRVDARSDLYAVGCILYQALCGRPPFVGGIEVIAAHMRDAPPPLRSIDSSVPEAVERVVMRLLAKNPNDRVQTCGELVSLLEAAITEPVTPIARFASSSLDTDHRLGRWPKLLAALAVVSIVVVVVSYLVTRSSLAGGRSEGAAQAIADVPPPERERRTQEATPPAPDAAQPPRVATPTAPDAAPLQPNAARTPSPVATPPAPDDDGDWAHDPAVGYDLDEVGHAGSDLDDGPDDDGARFHATEETLVYSITIRGTAGPTEVERVLVEPGSLITIRAQGMVCVKPSRCVGPDGDTERQATGSLAEPYRYAGTRYNYAEFADSPHAELVGWLVGHPIRVGSAAEFRAPRGGELVLFVNDSDVANNSGEFTVWITVQRSQSQVIE